MLSLAVAPGPHTLLLKHPDALDEQRPLSLTGDLDVQLNLWLRRPPAVQLRSPYTGASIAGAAFLADGRLALSIALPEPADRPGSDPAREAWLFDPGTGSLAPFAAEANPRAAMLAVSPDGQRLAFSRPAPAPQPSVANVGTRRRLDEVWVAGARANCAAVWSAERSTRQTLAGAAGHRLGAEQDEAIGGGLERSRAGWQLGEAHPVRQLEGGVMGDARPVWR